MNRKAGMKKLSIIAISLVTSYLLIANSSKAFAGISCQPIYGGGQSCISTNNISIDKTVLNPQSNQMVDNLSINDPKYQPDFITTFKIKVTNTGSNSFSNVEIKDIFPQYVSFSAGSGTFDQNTRTLVFSVKDLKANESRTFTVMGRVVEESSIPLAGGNICVVNQAMATTNTNEVAQDNSQFCIEKKSVPTVTKGGFPVLPSVPITTAPQTGPEALALFALIPAGLSGWFMIRYAGKKKGVN